MKSQNFTRNASGIDTVPTWMIVALSAFAGSCVALQSRINGGLSTNLGNGYLAALLSFAGGAVLLCAWAAVNKTARKHIAVFSRALRNGALPVWACTGGLCGAFFVMMQGLVSPLLGISLFSVGIVAGQVAGSVIWDRLGVSPGGKRRITSSRVCGAGLAVVAAATAVSDRLVSTDSGMNSLVWMVFPLLAGVGVAWQTSVNGRVRSITNSAFAATLMNFIVGTAALFVVAAVSTFLSGWPSHWPSEWWWYLGGPIGVVFIGIAAALTRVASVMMLTVANLAGQLVGALVIDAVFPLLGGVTLGMIAGVALAGVAVVTTVRAQTQEAKKHFLGK